MLRRQLDILFGTLLRRLAAWLALVGQGAAVLGLSLPPVAAKDRSSPFPCQQRQCGCLRAADCWSHCCCFSAAERLKWAREHQAEVPDSLVEQVRQSPDASPSGCCLKKAPTLTSAAKGWQRVFGLMARQCQGQDTLWGACEPSPPPPRAVTWSFDARPAAYWPWQSRRTPVVSQVPPVPPARG